MQSEFEKKLASFIKTHGLFDSAPKVVLAVSGGADSTALLYAMQTLKAENILKTEFVCAHINHQLRGAEADSDEAFVIAQAAGLNWLVTTKRVDVRGFARDHKLSIETAARQCRLSALMEIAKAHHCDRIATAHQKNDSAETVVHRLARGTGFRGLAGIWPKRLFADGATFIRPMLCVTREEVLDYLQSRHLTWCRDRTNTDCTYRRNFIRHRLLPALQRDWSPDGIGTVEMLSKLSHSARRFYDLVCERADEIWPSVAERTPGSVALDRNKLQDQPPPVKVELIRRGLTHLGCGQRALTRRHYERIMQLAAQDVTSRRIDLPGGFVVKYEYGNVTFSRNRREGCRVGFSSPVELKVPGQTRFDEYLIEVTISGTEEAGIESADLLSCHFDRRSAEGGPERRNLPFDKQRASHAARCLDRARHDRKGHVEQFDLEKLKLPLRIRHRRPGDRFVPLGLEGEKKVGKFLTAQRIPHEVRKKVVLLEDREKIIWVWPVRMSDRAKVTADTRQILQVQIIESGAG